jgi:hypothetical protein
MKTALFVIISCALAATADPAKPVTHNPIAPVAHIVAKPIPRPPLPPARVSAAPKRGAAPVVIGGPTLANSRGAAGLNGTDIRNQGGKK